MPHLTKFVLAAIAAALLVGLSNPASAHGRLYPLTRCGPDLGYLCRIHGYFNSAPFHYNLAILPRLASGPFVSRRPMASKGTGPSFAARPKDK